MEPCSKVSSSLHLICIQHLCVHVTCTCIHAFAYQCMHAHTHDTCIRTHTECVPADTAEARTKLSLHNMCASFVADTLRFRSLSSSSCYARLASGGALKTLLSSSEETRPLCPLCVERLLTWQWETRPLHPVCDEKLLSSSEEILLLCPLCGQLLRGSSPTSDASSSVQLL